MDEMTDFARRVFAEGIDGVKCVGLWQGYNTFPYARTRDGRFWEYDGEWRESANGRVVHTDLKEMGYKEE